MIFKKKKKNLKSSVSTITSNYGIVPVCVPDGKENYQNRYGYATGFGSFKIDGSNTSAVKLQVNLPILSDSQCKSKFSSQVDTYSQVCAGNNGQNRDTCAVSNFIILLFVKSSLK